MIKSLKILNFQSHAKTELEFANGVNVIVGSSDSGKTAIIRALRWLVWNRPSGDAIRSSWGGPTSVELSAEDGTTITRTKDKSDGYRMHGGERDLDFKAFGTSVPQEIVQSLNLSEINLQGQLDAPFLLSETPGTVAQHFNKIARLDKIDIGLQNVNSWIRELTADVKYKSEGEQAMSEQLTSFEYLEKFEAQVEVLEAMEKSSTVLVNGKRQLGKLMEDIQRIEKEQEEIVAILEIAPLVDRLVDLFAQEATLKETYGSLVRVLYNITDTEQELLKWQENALKLEERFHKEMPNICPLCEQQIKK